MIQIDLNQVVNSNPEYVTCEEGDFEDFEYVLCKRKSEDENDTCCFLAISVVGCE
jgi:hypothetical protein